MAETHTEGPSAYPPSDDFAAQANATAELYSEAEKDRLAFWAKQAEPAVLGHAVRRGAGLVGGAGREVVRRRQAQRRLQLRRPPRRGGQRRPGRDPLGGRARRTTAGTITYAELLAEVCKAANALTELGLVAGDRVAIYMPMVPEAIVAMLACARLG